MKSVHDILRERLLRTAGQKPATPWWLEFVPKKTLATLKDVEESVKRKWCPKFFKLMRNRLAMGFLRYELTNRGSGKKYDYVKAIQTKLDLYKETGNTEFLVDIGNYAMLEFKKGNHPLWHFSATDDVGHAEIKK